MKNAIPYQRNKMINRSFSIFIVLLTSFGASFSQKIVSSSLPCVSPHTTPVIFGKSYIVPPIPLRIIKASTSEKLVGVRMHALYIWKWLEHPYADHLFGAWSDERDFIDWRLEPNTEGLFVFPEYKVKPCGWNRPPLSPFNFFKNREPRFDRIEFSIESLEKYIDKEDPDRVDKPPVYSFGRHIFTRSDIEKLKRQGVSEMIIKVGHAVRQKNGGYSYPGQSIEFRYGK